MIRHHIHNLIARILDWCEPRAEAYKTAKVMRAGGFRRNAQGHWVK